MVFSMNLDELRSGIDEVDRELLRLFLRRMELVQQVADYKAANNLPIYQPKREEELLARIGQLAGKELSVPSQMLFAAMMDISKAVQHHSLADEGELAAMLSRAVHSPEPIAEGAVVACQGVRGAYSYLAAAHLVNRPERVCYDRFSDVCDAVLSGKARYGVLPLENSSAGSVGEVYDLLSRGGVYIIKAYDLTVTHCLLGKPEADALQVRTVYSHPQALSQCSEFIAAHRDITEMPCTNTAVAAQQVSQQGDLTCAALAHEECAALYGLHILARNVQNNDNNQTRFILISKTPAVYPDARRIALMLKTAHTPGSLYRVMSRFAARGMNITKIESRPIPERPFEFMFFFEFDGNVAADGVRALLQSLDNDPGTFRFLGNYALT